MSANVLISFGVTEEISPFSSMYYSSAVKARLSSGECNNYKPLSYFPMVPYLKNIPILSRLLGLMLTAHVCAYGGERAVVSLKDFRTVELKTIGFEVPRKMELHVKAVGAGGDYGWSYKSDNMVAYGWIIDAVTRRVVWEMDVDNTNRSKDDREFDGIVMFNQGKYEAYFTVPVFAHHTSLSHFMMNIDHRRKPLFETRDEKKKDFFGFFKGWWSEDIAEEWEKAAQKYGMEILVDENQRSSIKTFSPPKPFSNVLFRTENVGEVTYIKQGISILEPVSVHIYAIGEGVKKDDLVDFGWIVDTKTRERIWEMSWRNVNHGGGSDKNLLFEGDVSLPKGEYILHYVTDDSHSPLDWNSAPPSDPLNYGLTILAKSDGDAKKFTLTDAQDFKNVIVEITKVGDEESKSAGFALKQPSMVRVYAIGERSNSRRALADYGYIVDARTRSKVWTMDVDKTSHAGGASKNCYVDEVITLPKGNYVVNYITDDSHAYDDWNADAPFDADKYGITVMGAGDDFSMKNVGKFTEERDKRIITQITRVREDEDREERFKIDKTTRIRVYAIGEGQNREMFDYGWITEAKSGNVVWEMTYSMTFHGGGHRKNRMVNTTIVLDKGEYMLHYASDDSHSWNNWNVDPPEDPEFWGITLFRDDGQELPRLPHDRLSEE